MKQLKLTFLLTVLICMVGVTAFAHDIEVKNADDVTIYYVWSNNKTELAVSYRGSSSNEYSNEYTGDVVIPEYATYNGKTYSVTSIGDSAFYDCRGLTSITIPNSVTNIGNKAFFKCRGLTSITIPNSVISIGNYAFYYCRGLTSITIPNSVTNIGKEAFAGCSGLTKVTLHCKAIGPWFYCNENIKEVVIGDEVTNIGNQAFESCTGLTSITIPNSVTNIGNEAFASCTGLTSITIPNSVTNIGQSAFYGCTGLTSIVIPNSVTNIGDAAFYQCTGLTSVTIGNSVTSIGNSAFYNCTGLTSIEIPNSVTSIGVNAFYECTNLKTVRIGKSIQPVETIQIIDRNAFAQCKELLDFYCYSLPATVATNAFYNSDVEYATLHVPSSQIQYFKLVPPWSDFGTIVSLPQFKITYYVDGQEYKIKEVEEGETISPEPTPAKEGYTFSGWSDLPATMPAHDVTVTGTFTINTYKIVYMVDGKEYQTAEITYGAEVNPIPAPEKEGYTFVGWSNLPEYMPAHDVMAIANYEPNSYTLIYMVDGVEYKKTTEKYGFTVNPEDAPTKEGYTFSGWSDLPATMPAHDVTVTGTFTINTYKIVYIVDGVEYVTSEVTYGAEVNPIREPSKEGYTFSGWMNLPEYMPANDVTVTGSFSVNSYKVTFVYGDSVLTTIEVKYGAAIELPTSLNSERYTLVEWKDVPDTMPAHDITIYADYVDGINTITADSKDEQYIRLNGMYTPDLKPGLNIIRMKDGTTKKVWVK